MWLNVVSAVVAVVSAVAALLAWLTSRRAVRAAEREAAAAEQANKLAAAANQTASEALAEAQRARELQEEQQHQQNKPELSLTIGDVPDQGWIPLHLWCEVPFDSATITLPAEFRELFAGLGPGPADPQRIEYSPIIVLSATEASSTVTRGLWVYEGVKTSGVTIRLVCEVSVGSRSWTYSKSIEFPIIPPAPRVAVSRIR